jgi:hypothetical protein
MDVEFVTTEPEDSGGADDVIEFGRARSGRRHPRLVGAGLAALVLAGGIGWYAGRSDTKPTAAPSTRTHGPAPKVWNDELAGCPDTLACDANHQVQQRVIDLIREKMREQELAAQAARQAQRPPPSGLGNVGRNYVVD